MFSEFTRTPAPIKFKNGHTFTVKPEEYFLTDDSGETVKIDLNSPIAVSASGTFLVPVEGNVTPASMDEAFQLAAMLGLPIEVSGKAYQVSDMAGMGMGLNGLFDALADLEVAGEWTPTHRSVHDGSPVRLISASPDFLIENEDGEQWVDDAENWIRTDGNL